ncbi:MAG: M24 family metallopeptidase, partial [Oscillospiraceae bacterium]
MLKKITLKNKCFCGSGLPYPECHGRYDDAMKTAVKTGRQVPKRSLIKTRSQLEAMRDSAKINIAVLDLVGEKICAGMTTEDIDRLVYEKTKEMGGIPAPLNYEGFPKSVCVSVNAEVCHGIPSPKRVLKDGD